jgi:signal peptide peptidase SppA
MIEPSKLEEILAFMGPRLQTGELPEPRGERRTPKPYLLRGSTAMVPVQGTLVQRSSGMDGLSGMTSYETIAATLNQAIADPDVKSILLDVDSPGGEVAGCFECVDAIYKARSQKPIWAYVNEFSASAAYALASAAENIVTARTGMLGSIGVVATRLDATAADAMRGVAYHNVYAGSHKVDTNPHEPVTDEILASYQQKVDDAYGVFVRSVARNRNMSVEAVRDTEAEVFTAPQAIKRGLADNIGTLGGTLAALERRVEGGPPPSSRIAALSGKEKVMSENSGWKWNLLRSLFGSEQGEASAQAVEALEAYELPEGVRVSPQARIITTSASTVPVQMTVAPDNSAMEALKAELEVERRERRKERVAAAVRELQLTQRTPGTAEADMEALLLAAEAGPSVYDAVLKSLKVSQPHGLSSDPLDGAAQVLDTPKGRGAGLAPVHDYTLKEFRGAMKELKIDA